MATLTGSNLLDSIIDSSGIEPNALIQATLSARLQQLIDDGTFSNLAAALAMSGFSTEINAGTEVPLLSDTIDTNVGLIEAAAEDEVDDIDFPDYGVAPVGAYYIDADASTVTEGNAVTFTVTAVDADGNPTTVTEETTLTYQVQGVETDVAAAATPLDDLGVLNGTVTFEAGASTATFALTPVDEGLTEGFEAFKVTLLNEDNTAGDATDNILIKDPPNAGQTFALTVDVDDFSGGAGNDTFNAVVNDTDGATNSTWTALDDLDGGGGDDVLNFNILTTSTDDKSKIDLALGTIANIETFNIRALDDIDGDLNDGGEDESLDLSDIEDLTTVNTTKSVDARLIAADTTDVNVSGATGDTVIDGGKDITVTDSAGVTIGDTTVGVGTVIVTDAKDADAGINIDGGTDVTVTTTTTADGDSSDITVGQGGAATDLPSGTVTITQNLEDDGSVGVTAGDISVSGGSTITITANLTTTSEATADTNAVTAGTYTANAGDATTEITVIQNTTSNYYAGKDASTAAVAEETELTFGALAVGESVWIHEGASNGLGTDLTFTATAAMDAEEVAAAFANLTDGDTQAAGGILENGYFTGDLDAGWTSGAADGDTVTFTNVDAGAADDLGITTRNAGDTDDATNDADFDENVTIAGAAASGDAEAANTSADFTTDAGNVVIDDNGTASVTTVTIDGFAAADIGTNTTMGGLTTLNLANGTGAATVDAVGVDALDVTIDGMVDASSIDTSTASTLSTLNLTATGSASDVTFTEVDATTVNITADADLDLSDGGGTFDSATEISITGAGDVNISDVSGSVETLDAQNATGGITAIVAGDTATVTTGDGDDQVTVDTDDITEDIILGDGNDTLVLNDDSTVAIVATSVDGGDGDADTVSMTIASAEKAAGYSANSNFAAAISGFERLVISDIVGANNAANVLTTVDMGALGFGYVTTTGTYSDADPEVDSLLLENMDSGDTVVLTAEGTIEANLEDDTAGTDTFNVIVNTEDAQVDAGTFTLNGVETINLTSQGVFTDDDDDGEDDAVDEAELVLSADEVTSIDIDGYAQMDLDTDSTVLTSVDASDMTGVLKYTADGAVAGTTVTGGDGADELTGFGAEDVLIGGAGNDTLIGAKLTSMTGGDGNDIFSVTTGSLATEFSYINDIQAGDVIDLTDGNEYIADKFSQIGAGLSEYVDAAILNTDEDETSWFNLTIGATDYTFIVDHQQGDAATEFDADTDMIVAIVGTYDLSQANYNMDDGTIEIA